MAGSKCDGSTMLNFASLPRLGGVTLVHVAPASFVTCKSPSSEPAHITPAFAYDSARVNTVAYHSVPVMSYVTGPPDGPIVDGSCNVRSGEIAFHVCPSSVVR